MNSLIRFLIDPLRATADEVPHQYRLERGKRAWVAAIAAGLLLLGMSFAIGAASGEGHGLLSIRFHYAYLVGYVFVLTIALGALFFVLIQHVTRSMWSATVRRLAEFLMMSFPLLALLSLPILFSMHDVYHWTHEELYAEGPYFDAVLAGKRPYLNTPFFIARVVVYFAVWIFLSIRLYTLSIRQDVEPAADTGRRLRVVSAYGIPLYAVTVAFASYDFLMSLDPHWFSTIFGVYFFSGAFFVVLAAMVLFAQYTQRIGKLGNVITSEHYHDLGKFMFAFTVFWAYIAFSQYMLIWYGNLPEETIWYRHRFEGSWMTLTTLLIVGHFFIPFFGMITRVSKRIRGWMTAMSLWFLFIHFVDLYWVAMPSMDLVTEGHGHGFSLHVLDLTVWLGFLSLYTGFVLFRARRHAIAAFNDPAFNRSLTFENA